MPFTQLREETKTSHVSSRSVSSILLVDDESDIVVTLRSFLEEEGYHIDIARTGADALERIKEREYDAIFLDIRLPDIEGLLVLERMAKSVHGLPVVILTGGMTFDPVTRPCEQKGAVDSLHKPIGRPRIKTLIRHALHAQQLAKKIKHTHHAIQERGHSFQEVFNTAQDAIVLANHQGQIISWNPSAESMFGYSAEEIFEQPFSRILPFRYREAHARGMKHLQKTAEDEVLGTTLSLHGLRKNGEEFPIELSLNSWKNGSHPTFSCVIKSLLFLESHATIQNVAMA